VVGWGWAGGQALALAAAMPVQACVSCDGPIPEDTSHILGLRGTNLLRIFGSEDVRAQKALPVFREALRAAQVPLRFHVAKGARAGFMGPPGQPAYAHEAAEQAWIHIYEFLEKYVEDASPDRPTADATAGPKPVATIADIMRGVNDPAGLRGTLSKALEQEPASAREWERVRANAALIAEAGNWLEKLPPRKGARGHWQEQARAFTSTAQAIVAAADRHDFPGARQGLQQLAAQCAACHAQHR
jgi:hypothetical protein